MVSATFHIYNVQVGKGNNFIINGSIQKPKIQVHLFSKQNEHMKFQGLKQIVFQDTGTSLFNFYKWAIIVAIFDSVRPQTNHHFFICQNAMYEILTS